MAATAEASVHAEVPMAEEAAVLEEADEETRSLVASEAALADPDISRRVELHRGAAHGLGLEAPGEW